eukprot:COSAG06_NODE_466_length_15349_cov_53.328262_1_plen_55_part_00
MDTKLAYFICRADFTIHPRRGAEGATRVGRVARSWEVARAAGRAAGGAFSSRPS